jgi:hypothetical protein
MEWQRQRTTEVLGQKPVPVPLCPPQISYEPTWDQTRAVAVKGRRLHLSLSNVTAFKREK